LKTLKTDNTKFNFSYTGEALGAIGNKEVLPILEKYSKDPVIEVFMFQ
jgi:hypothetical protein